MPLGHPIVLLNRLGSIHLSAHMSCSACVFVNSMASNCCELQLVPCTAPTSYPFNTLNPLSSFGCFRMSDIEVINLELSSQEHGKHQKIQSPQTEAGFLLCVGPILEPALGLFMGHSPETNRTSSTNIVKINLGCGRLIRKCIKLIPGAFCATKCTKNMLGSF